MTAAIQRAMELALADASLRPRDLGCILAAAHGSRGLDPSEAAAIARLVGRAVPVTSIKPLTGETLGAAGALQVAAALEILAAGVIPPTLNLEPDPAIADIFIAAGSGLAYKGGAILANSVDRGGAAVSLVIGRGKEAG